MKKILKRPLALLLCVLLALSPTALALTPLTANAVRLKFGHLSYEIRNNEVTITRCDTSASGDLIIPSKIESWPVASIDDYVFSDCISLTSITIPDGFKSIGGCAFNKCTSLTSITIPDSVTSIGSWAFDNCTALSDVYYTGTLAQWSAVSDGGYNEPLLNAALHFIVVEEIEVKKPSEKIKQTAVSSVAVSPDVMVAELLAALTEGVKADGAAQKPYTGMKIRLIRNGAVVDSVTICVKGDVDGDSGVTAADARLTLRQSVNLEKPDGAYLEAANVDGEKVSASDARLILRASVNLEKPQTLLK